MLLKVLNSSESVVARSTNGFGDVNVYEELEKYGVTFAAAVYLWSDSTDKADSDREIAAMLKKVFQFKYSTENIVIIDSYIDRAGSRTQWGRLIRDAGLGHFQGVLHFGDLESSIDLRSKGLLLIDVSR
ncbi:hypothetical protein [Cohnella massiliensis]|uniref:hypothetical protein n=1 Tax=Cohnella massiliensis TaxID=1816691 RepID=UPI0009BAC12D|nr:hypothetical protein [Cohnella massiliensis]